MLSFDTVHAITDQLLAATAADLKPGRLTTAPTLLLLEEHTAPASRTRFIRTLHIRLAIGTGGYRPLPDLLHDTAETLNIAGRFHPIIRAAEAPPTDTAGRATDRRLLGWAVRYDDIDVTTAALQPVRRVDAVDIDGRVYQLAVQHADTRPAIDVDDHPAARNCPATVAGLAGLVLATGRPVDLRVRP